MKIRSFKRLIKEKVKGKGGGGGEEEGKKEREVGKEREGGRTDSLRKVN